MKRWLFALAMLIGLLALAACAGKEEARASPTPAAGVALPPEWEQALAAAKREGRVTIAGAPGDQARRALTEPFEKKYGITVEYTGQSGTEFGPKVRTEREAGQYLWDIYMGGATTALTVLKEIKALDPVEPALILPEVKDPKSWRDNKPFFVDNDRTILSMTVYSSGPWYVNPNLVDPKQFKSWKDLLDPKWKGKIIMHDPRLSGSGQGRFQMFYMHPELGADFIKALAPQLTLFRDYPQGVEWIATGRYAVNIAGHESLEDEAMEKGAPIVRIDPSQLKEGGFLASGIGNVALFSRAPHPNAAKVYLNWLLSKDGATQLSEGLALPVWRVDVPWKGDPGKVANPRYVNTVGEESHKKREEIRRIAQEIFGQ
ncbi:MAG TPA: extracellular solute-binding protein [Dehalococcoidia bacterium]|nr:extracellular solute-binding protein [Dehalococcoidia bacterium]